MILQMLPKTPNNYFAPLTNKILYLQDMPGLAQRVQSTLWALRDHNMDTDEVLVEEGVAADDETGLRHE